MTNEQLCFEIDVLMAEKESLGKGPLQVDMMELIAVGVPSKGLIHQLRQLVRSGVYTGSMTVNGTPILRRKEK